MGVWMRRRVSLSIEDDLRDPEAIWEVDKNEAAMIAPALHPSHQMDALADLGAPKLATGMRAGRHDATLPPTLALEEGGEGRRGSTPPLRREFWMAALSRWISGSVRKRYSPGGSVPSFNGPNRNRLSFRTGCPTTS